MISELLQLADGLKGVQEELREVLGGGRSWNYRGDVDPAFRRHAAALTKITIVPLVRALARHGVLVPVQAGKQPRGELIVLTSIDEVGIKWYYLYTSEKEYSRLRLRDARPVAVSFAQAFAWIDCDDVAGFHVDSHSRHGSDIPREVFGIVRRVLAEESEGDDVPPPPRRKRTA